MRPSTGTKVSTSGAVVTTVVAGAILATGFKIYQATAATPIDESELHTGTPLMPWEISAETWAMMLATAMAMVSILYLMGWFRARYGRPY